MTSEYCEDLQLCIYIHKLSQEGNILDCKIWVKMCAKDNYTMLLFFKFKKFQGYTFWVIFFFK